MRAIGTISTEQDARRFADYLLTLKIRSRPEPSSNGCIIWVIDEDHLARAQDELATFQRNPADPRYGGAARTAELIRKEQTLEEKRFRKNFIDLRSRWSRANPRRAKLQQLKHRQRTWWKSRHTGQECQKRTF